SPACRTCTNSPGPCCPTSSTPRPVHRGTARRGRRPRTAHHLLRPGTRDGGHLGLAASIAVVDALTNDGVLENVKHRGAELHTGLTAVAERHPQVSAVRGTGLMYAVEMCGPDGGPAHEAISSHLRLAMEDRGVLVSALAISPAIMIIPPLVISAEDVTQIVTALDEALAELGP
ncbi:aminotransferase class III-fold pyridoxal phosphate-dependent enzyme, partial [Streptosporangium algeriense]